MSTKSGGSFATILLALPLTAIALMGVFGVPEFASVIASPDRSDLQRRPFGGSSDNRDYDPYYDAQRDYPREAGFDPRRDPFADDAPAFGESGSAPARRVDDRDRYYSGDRPAERYAEASPDARYAQTSASPAAERAYDSRATSVPNGNPFMAPASSDSRPMARADHRSPNWDERTASAATTQAMDWRGAARKLADMGIDRYHLERGSTPDSFLFVCLVTPGDNTNVTHRFEAEHTDPLAAVGQVLQQVDGWLQQRYAQGSFPGRHASASR